MLLQILLDSLLGLDVIFPLQVVTLMPLVVIVTLQETYWVIQKHGGGCDSLAVYHSEKDGFYLKR